MQKYGTKHSCDHGDREHSCIDLSQCNFIHQNSHTNGPGVDVGTPRIDFIHQNSHTNGPGDDVGTPRID